MASTSISMPRWNIVALVLFLIPFGLGLAATATTDNATGAIAGLVLGGLLGAAALRQRALAEGHAAATGPAA